MSETKGLVCGCYPQMSLSPGMEVASFEVWNFWSRHYVKDNSFFLVWVLTVWLWLIYSTCLFLSLLICPGSKGVGRWLHRYKAHSTVLDRECVFSQLSSSPLSSRMCWGFLFCEVRSHYVVQASLDLRILLPQPLECWDYIKYALSCRLMCWSNPGAR